MLTWARSPAARCAGIAAALCAVTLAAYSNSFRAGFALDNRFLLLDDFRLRQPTPENVRLILHHTYWWPKVESGLYRPLTTLSYLFNYAVLGGSDHPAGYHWINFLLHAGNVLLVYALALRLLRDLRLAACAAALWAVHPVLTESVTNIVGRADLLSGIALLGGLLVYGRSAETAGWRRLLWLAGLMAVTAVGLFSKENAVSIAGVIVVYELAWWKGRRSMRNLLWGGLALAPPFLWFWMERTAVLAASQPAEFPYIDNPLVAADFWTARLTALAVMGRYLWLMLWPAHLSCDYSYPQILPASGTLADWTAWMALAALVAALAFLARRNRLWLFLAGFASIIFLPVSNLVIPIGTIMAERFLYLPSVAFCIALALALEAAGRRIGVRVLAVAAMGLIVAAYGFRTWQRNWDWQDNIALWTAAIRTCPNSAKTHGSLAFAMYESDPSHANIDTVIAEAEKSLALVDLVPDTLGFSTIYMQAGAYYRVKGDRVARAEALPWYRRSLAVLLRGESIDRAFNDIYRERQLAQGKRPDRVVDSGLVDLYTQLSLTYLRLANIPKAFEAALYARVLSYDKEVVYRQLAQVFLANRQPEEAAVVLIEGYLISDDRKLLAQLQELYRQGLDPQGCAVTRNGAGASLDLACEPVRRQVCAATADMMQLYLRIHQPGAAQRTKITALQKFGCPAGPLDKVLPEGPVF